jgi:hypothetical protein
MRLYILYRGNIRIRYGFDVDNGSPGDLAAVSLKGRTRLKRNAQYVTSTTSPHDKLR